MNLLHAKRYTIEIPPELGGQVLTFDVTVDGETTQGGGTTVEGGSTVVLLLRRDQKSRKIEYCWSAGSTLARGVLDDPLSDAGVTSWRNEGPIKPGDWFLRGGKERVNVFPATEPAEFELRLAFQFESAVCSLGNETQRPLVRLSRSYGRVARIVQAELRTSDSSRWFVHTDGVVCQSVCEHRS